MNNKDPKIVRDALMRAYQALGFTSEEAEGTLNDLSAIQQVAAATELVKSLTKEEAASLSKNLLDKSPEDKQKAAENMIRGRLSEGELKTKVAEATEKVLQERIAYLKSRGNEEVNQILAEI